MLTLYDIIMSGKVVDFLQERFQILSSKYYQERCEDDESNREDHTFFKMILKEVESDSVDNEDFIIFKLAVLKANRFPMYPLYKTLAINLLQLIVYNKYPWSHTKLDNINEINVEFNRNFNDLVDKFKKLLMLTFNLTKLAHYSDKQNEPIGQCSHHITHPCQKYESSKELEDELSVTNLDNSSFSEGKISSYTKEPITVILPNDDSLVVDTGLPTSSVAMHNTCEELPFSRMVLSESFTSINYPEHFNNKSTNNFTDLDNNIIEIFRTLQKTDILRLLGIGKTVGSTELLPPPLWTLWQSYCKIHHPKSKLMVGARALSKHCNRSSDCWWGCSTGTEDNKNKHSLKLLENIFVDISWINIHTLPHDVIVLEVRCSQGYGLRWSHDGNMFRGFLEPQMVDGHDKKWKH